MIKPDMKIISIAQGHLSGLKLWGISHAPTILTYVGVASQIIGMIDACVKTANMPEIIEERDWDLDALRLDWVDKRMTDKDYRRAVGSRYISFGLKVGQNYLIPAALEIFGIACILKGHGMMLTRCAALGTLLMEATERENRLEESIRREYGEEVLDKLKRGEPIGEIGVCGPDGEFKQEKVYDYIQDFEFIWDVGMGDFCPNDNAMNHAIVRQIELWGKSQQLPYGGLCRINDIYRRFGAYFKIRSEYDKAEIGFPNKLIKDYPLKIVAIEQPLPFDREGATAPPLLIKFERKPISCLDLQIDHGFQRD